jgi:hypothetical protein
MTGSVEADEKLLMFFLQGRKLTNECIRKWKIKKDRVDCRHGRKLTNGC